MKKAIKFVLTSRDDFDRLITVLALLVALK